MKIILNFIHFLLVRFVWFISFCLYKSYKFEVKKSENIEKAKSMSLNGGYLFASWHENAVSNMFCYSGLGIKHPCLALTSRSKDGDFAAYVSTKLGFIPVRGSSRKKRKDKGGKEALMEYIEKVGKGYAGAITVDGPKGPRRICKPGVVAIAQQTNCTILPVAALPSSYWEFNSWDRFKIAKFFATITLVVGEPILVSSDLGKEEFEQMIKHVSDSLTDLDKDYFKI